MPDPIIISGVTDDGMRFAQLGINTDMFFSYLRAGLFRLHQEAMRGLGSRSRRLSASSQVFA